MGGLLTAPLHTAYDSIYFKATRPYKSNTTTSALAPKRIGSKDVPTPRETNKEQPGTS
jgi:hypothetical protein